jgi:hypothetical protein
MLEKPCLSDVQLNGVPLIGFYVYRGGDGHRATILLLQDDGTGEFHHCTSGAKAANVKQ